jgi:endonuclease/exonuclease/phosphatase family metal-dependent hydrolase
MRFLASLFWLLAGFTLHAASETPPLRVLCWNIHHGVGEDGKLDLERIAKIIRDAEPDLVALQEVDQHCLRSGNADQTAELARLTEMTGVFGKAMDFQGGGYGQAILTRHPVLNSSVHQLPGEGEPRIAFEVALSIDGHEMRMITLHLDLDAKQRLTQAEALVKLVENRKQPTIICGDFNATPESPPLMAFARDWKAVPKKTPAFTCPAGKPTTEIDHFFVRGFTHTAPLTVLPEAVASDHRPLLAELLRN